MITSGTPRTEYQKLESIYYAKLREGKYPYVVETLRKMIDLVKVHPKSFDEPDDRIRELQARTLMVTYRERRNLPGQDLPKILREVADWSTPNACVGKACEESEFPRCAWRAMLSFRGVKMCIEKFNAICSALHREAAIAVRNFDYQQALEKRRNAVGINKAIVGLEPKPRKKKMRLLQQNYLEYWYYISEGAVSLINADFGSSKRWFQEALEKAKLAPLSKGRRENSRCFPNYFHNIREIQAHEIYIDAVEKFKLAEFGDAYLLFQKWLNLNLERSGKKDLRFDNIQIFAMICGILERLPRGEVERDDWEDLNRFADDAYVAKPTGILLSKLNSLRELLFKSKGANRDTSRFNLVDEVRNMAQEWRLLIMDIELLGQDKEAGPKGHTELPLFVDILGHLHRVRHNWQQLLLQNLKNLFLLVADYEYMRYHDPPLEEIYLPREGTFDKPSEKMDILTLLQAILAYWKCRGVKQGNVLERAFDKYFLQLTSAIEADNLTEAIVAEKNLIEHIRPLPHVVRVEEQRELAKPIFLDEDNPNFLARETTCSRLWDRRPDTVIFEGSQDLIKGAFYYLRPSWNVRLYERYRIRHQQFHYCDLPRQMCVLYENIFIGSKVDVKRFHDWILQFGDQERLLACKLFDALEVYDEDKMRKGWADIFDKKLPPEVKAGQVVYIGTGHGAKSGRICPYYFRQGVSTLPEYKSYFEPKKVFRDIAEFENANLGLSKPHYVVFLDDFIGTGGQAVDFLNWYFEKYLWLKKASVYYCALCGFEKAVNDVKAGLGNRVDDVIVGKMLFEKDRAFSPESPLWESKETRIEAKEWAEEIGRQVVPDKPPYDPDRDKLGWYGCQALITFHHNIPSDTLPIFWGNGERKGRKWIPLQKRYD